MTTVSQILKPSGTLIAFPYQQPGVVCGPSDSDSGIPSVAMSVHTSTLPSITQSYCLQILQVRKQ